jgi:hypothetical protein
LRSDDSVENIANQRSTLSTPQRMLVMTAVLPSMSILKALATISNEVFSREVKDCSLSMSICAIELSVSIIARVRWAIITPNLGSSLLTHCSSGCCAQYVFHF